MRSAFFCLQSGWGVHLIHDLELIQCDLEEGVDVHVIEPGRLLRFNNVKPRVDFRKRLRGDLGRLRAGLSLLSGEITVHAIDDLIVQDPGYARLQALEFPTFTTHEQLHEYRFDDHDCGNAVLSSLVSNLRDTAVDLTQHREVIERSLDTSIKVYLATRVFLERFAPDRVNLFNGRGATFRGILRACQAAKVECFVHESGVTLDRINLARNTMPHDAGWVNRSILEHWDVSSHSDEEKRRIGATFFERQKMGEMLDGTPYTRHQRRGELPEEIERVGPLYSIFTSSEFERKCFPQWYRYACHESQLDGIQDVIRILKERGFPGTLCIRIHPNSRDEKPFLQGILRREVKDDFVKIVDADSPVDSYALIEASDKVITFGSTVGVEATFQRKPAISLATSRFLGGVHHPQTREEAAALIGGEALPGDYEGALKYGYYHLTSGHRLRHAKSLGDRRSFSFKGMQLRRTDWRFWRKGMFPAELPGEPAGGSPTREP
jgi:hypothetical protein